jgi:hypothetical protein
VSGDHLIIISDRVALGWVLSNERMAFPRHRAREVSRVRSSDRLLIYTTRGCFHNPTRDRGRVIALARATSSVRQLRRPVILVGRTFELGLSFELEALAPLGTGVELAPLVSTLSVFRNKEAWGATLRRPLIVLPPRDAAKLSRLVFKVAEEPSAVIGKYLAAARPVQVRARP